MHIVFRHTQDAYSLPTLPWPTQTRVPPTLNYRASSSMPLSSARYRRLPRACQTTPRTSGHAHGACSPQARIRVRLGVRVKACSVFAVCVPVCAHCMRTVCTGSVHAGGVRAAHMHMQCACSRHARVHSMHMHAHAHACTCTSVSYRQLTLPTILRV